MDSRGFSQEELNALLQTFDSEAQQNIAENLTHEILPSGYFSISLKGRTFGYRESDLIFRSIKRIVQEVNQHVIIDLSNCSYLSSFAIGAISQLAIVRGNKGLKMILVGTNDTIKDIIHLSQLTDLFTFCSTVEEAVTLLDKGK
jgi:anti-anti-sigma factor